jgi:hypothetical protein
MGETLSMPVRNSMNVPRLMGMSSVARYASTKLMNSFRRASPRNSRMDCRVCRRRGEREAMRESGRVRGGEQRAWALRAGSVARGRPRRLTVEPICCPCLKAWRPFSGKT